MGKLNWEVIAEEMQRRWKGVLEVQVPEDAVFQASVQNWEYPPKILIEAWVPLTDEVRKQEIVETFDGNMAVRAEIDDHELQAIAQFVADVAEAAGPGLKVYLDWNTRKESVLWYWIQPKDYEKWSKGDFK